MPLLGPGSKGLPRVFCTTQTLFCTGATPFRTSARGLLLAGSQRPFAPSPNHFRELSLFRQFPRSAAPKSGAVLFFVSFAALEGIWVSTLELRLGKGDERRRFQVAESLAVHRMAFCLFTKLPSLVVEFLTKSIFHSLNAWHRNQ